MKRWCISQRTIVDGINFPSKLEASVYSSLKLMERAGEISNIRCGVKLNICGKLNWKVDFVVFNEKLKCDQAHEAKGREFARFTAQVQAWSGHGPMDLFIWKGTAIRPVIVKTVRAKNE